MNEVARQIKKLNELLTTLVELLSELLAKL